MAHPLILFGFLFCTMGIMSMKTLNHVIVRTGGNVTIPCLYDDQYKLNPKYWCEGLLWISCEIKAHTNKTGKWQITDYPAKNIFTVHLNNLTTSDSGYHWCAVGIGSHAKPDDKDNLYLTVKIVPDLSVVSSSVTGQEGGNISVQCLYSSGYKNKYKQWCIFKDERCYTVGRTDTSQNSSVQIGDDGRESFTVMMTGLTESDSGWYWCSVGKLQVPVQLFVQRKNKSKTENDRSSDNAGSASHDKEDSKYIPDASSELRNRILPLLWIAGPLLLLLMVVLLTWRIKRKHNGALVTQAPDATSMTEGHLCYDTVVFKKGKNHEPDQDQISIRRPTDQDYEVIYSTLKLH
ncbi:CMRF35-like molecule 1 isoform X2 [Myxocyprinus asiaticus]|uniref:CMRF35-like molecule 1 isoform X2 n=1 Tax=Myxocyprinus asiaticus TaxID=70543 RepID=UPI00222145E1|nr:CMRF35-like molecule 1 isoform X2 [Myxocyprinus asiaticus]